jgi:hypothetical protein
MSSTLIDDHIIIHNDVKCYLLDILEAEMIQQMYICFSCLCFQLTFIR